MRIPQEILDCFFAEKPSAKTKFGINASVSVVEGAWNGKSGAIVSLSTIEPEVTYVVEFGDGSETTIAENFLRPI